MTASPTAIDAGESVTFTVAVQSGAGCSASQTCSGVLQFGDGSSAALCTHTGSITVSHIYASAGVFQAGTQSSIGPTSGCNQISLNAAFLPVIQVTVSSDPSLSPPIVLSPGSGDNGQNVQIQATGSGGPSNTYTFTWSTSATPYLVGCTSDGRSPTSTLTCGVSNVATSGAVTVYVYIQDGNGCYYPNSGTLCHGPPIQGQSNAVAFTVYSDSAFSGPTVQSPGSGDNGQKVKIQVTATGGAPSPTFTWSVSSTTYLTGCSNDGSTPTQTFTCTVANVVVSQSVIVYVYMEDTNSCFYPTSGTTCSGPPSQSQEASVPFTVYQDPTSSLSGPIPSTADVGQTVTFTATQTYGAPGTSTYTWTELNGNLNCFPLTTYSTTGSSTLSCTPIAAGGPWTITMYITDSNGQSTSTLTSSGVTVVSDPTLLGAPVATPGNIFLGTSVTFTDAGASGGQPPYTYSWSLPPGCVSSNSLSITCTPTVAGSYTVAITVSDSTCLPNNCITNTMSVPFTVYSNTATEMQEAGSLAQVTAPGSPPRTSIPSETFNIFSLPSSPYGTLYSIVGFSNTGDTYLVGVSDNWPGCQAGFETYYSWSSAAGVVQGTSCDPTISMSLGNKIELELSFQVVAGVGFVCFGLTDVTTMQSPWSSCVYQPDPGSVSSANSFVVTPASLNPYGYFTGPMTETISNALCGGVFPTNTMPLPIYYLQSPYAVNAYDVWSEQYAIGSPPCASYASPVLPLSPDYGTHYTLVNGAAALGNWVATEDLSNSPVQGWWSFVTDSRPTLGRYPTGSIAITVPNVDVGQVASFRTEGLNCPAGSCVYQWYANKVYQSGGTLTALSYQTVVPGMIPIEIFVKDSSGNTYGGGVERLAYPVLTDPLFQSEPAPSPAGTVPVGYYPWGLYIDPGTHIAFVVNSDNGDPYGTIVEVDTVHNVVLRSIPTSLNTPRGVWYDSKSMYIWLAGGISGVVDVFTLLGVPVASIPTGSGTTPESLVYDPVNKAIWVAGFEAPYVVEISTSTFQIIKTISTGPGSFPEYVAIDPSENLLFVTDSGGFRPVQNTVHVINTVTGEVLHDVSLPTYPYSQDILYIAGHDVIVTGQGSSVVSEFSDLDFPITVNTIPAPLGAFGVAYDPQLDLLVIGGQSSNTAQFYCASTFQPIMQTTPSGPRPVTASVVGPIGVAFDPSRDLVAFESSGAGIRNLVSYDVSHLAGDCPKSLKQGFLFAQPPSAFVGQTVKFNIYNMVGGTGSYTFAFFNILMGIGGSMPCSVVYPPPPLGGLPYYVCIPRSPGIYLVWATAVDTNSFSVRTQTLLYTVHPVPIPTPIMASSSSGSVNGLTLFMVGVVGGTTGLTFQWSGLPTGCASSNTLSFAYPSTIGVGNDSMSQNATLGVLPCVPSAKGSFLVNVTAVDASGYAINTTAIAFSVHDPPNGKPTPTYTTTSTVVGNISYLNVTEVVVNGGGHYDNDTVFQTTVVTAQSGLNWTTTITVANDHGKPVYEAAITTSVVNGIFITSVQVLVQKN